MIVSCITPTAGRRDFWSNCVKHFLVQDWPDLEWVIVDNGEDTMHDLLPDDSQGLFLNRRLTYVRIPGPRLKHGELMNIAMTHARGKIAIVWDDDDWYAPDRVRKQVQPLVDRPEIDIVGTGRLYYYIYGTKRAFLYRNLTPRAWLAAPAFRRSIWEAHKFEDMPQGSDTILENKVLRERWLDLNDLGLLVASIHPGNAAAKRVPNPALVETPWEEVEKVTKGTL